MISLIFTFLVVCFIFGALKGAIGGICERVFHRYGGFFGTLWAFAINTIQFCIICWLVSLILPVISWDLGLTLGPLYCAYCWIFNKENKLLSLIAGRG